MMHGDVGLAYSGKECMPHACAHGAMHALASSRPMHEAFAQQPTSERAASCVALSLRAGGEGERGCREALCLPYPLWLLRCAASGLR